MKTLILTNKITKKIRVKGLAGVTSYYDTREEAELAYKNMADRIARENLQDMIDESDENSFCGMPSDRGW